MSTEHGETTTIHAEKGDVHARITPKTRGKEIGRLAELIESGELPSNEDLNMFGDLLDAPLTEIKREGDEKTAKLAKDIRDSLDAISEMMQSVNYDELIQSTIQEIQLASTEGKKESELSPNARGILLRMRRMAPSLQLLVKSLLFNPHLQDFLRNMINILHSKSEFLQPKAEEDQVPESEKGVEGPEGYEEGAEEQEGFEGYEGLEEQVGFEGYEGAEEQVVFEDQVPESEERSEEPVPGEPLKKTRGRSAIPKMFEKTAAQLGTELTPEEKDILTTNFLDNLRTIREDENYQQIMTQILEFLDDLQNYYTVALEEVPYVQRTRIQHIFENLKEIFGRACDHSLDPLLHHAKKLYKDKNRENLIELRRQLKDLILDPNEQYDTNESIQQQLDYISDIMDTVNEDSKGELQFVFDEIKRILDSIQSDNQMNRLTDKLQHIFQTAVRNEEGKVDPFAFLETMQHVQQSLVPVLRQRFTSTEFPRIEIESSDYLFVLDVMDIIMADLLPQHVQLKTEILADVDYSSNIANNIEATYFIELSNFDIHANNVAFAFKKKTGITYGDYGNISLYAEDISLRLWFEQVLEEGIPHLSFKNAKMHESSFNLSIKESKHQGLDGFVSTVFKPMIQHRMQRTVESLIGAICSRLCDQINEMVEKASEVQKKASRKPYGEVAQEMVEELEPRKRVKEAKPRLYTERR